MTAFLLCPKSWRPMTFPKWHNSSSAPSRMQSTTKRTMITVKHYNAGCESRRMSVTRRKGDKMNHVSIIAANPQWYAVIPSWDSTGTTAEYLWYEPIIAWRIETTNEIKSDELVSSVTPL